jgi:predicted MPP superfamily phosphohydrolase
LRRFLLLGLLSAVGLLGLVIWKGMANARAEPIQRSLDVRFADWTPGSPPVRVALLSDIHLGNRAMDVSRLRSIISSINAAKPDLVLIAGDFVSGHDPVSSAEQASALTPPLTELRAPLGVIAVLGNHDNWVAPGRIRTALTEAGIIVLENEAQRRGALAIVGIGDRFSGHDDVAKAVEAARQAGGAPIVLTHSPDLASILPPGYPLVLAGHTHCGQVVVPGFGSIIEYSPKQRFRRLYDARYRCGVIRDPARTTIVTGGLGSGTIPVRLGAMPDWWLVTIGSNGAEARQQPTP